MMDFQVQTIHFWGLVGISRVAGCLYCRHTAPKSKAKKKKKHFGVEAPICFLAIDRIFRSNPGDPGVLGAEGYLTGPPNMEVESALQRRSDMQM